MPDYHKMSDLDLICAEDALDFRDPDILQEIFSRAEDIEPGITAQYTRSFAFCGLDSDAIFKRAIGYLLIKESSL